MSLNNHLTHVTWGTHLALGPDADVPRHGTVGVVSRLLNAQVSKGVFTKYGAGVQVGCHEAAFTQQRLQATMKHGEKG